MGQNSLLLVGQNCLQLYKRMNAILDMLLADQLTQDEYAQKKRSFVEEKKEIEMKLAAFARQGDLRFEPLIGFYKTAVLAGESSVSGNPAENLEIMKKIGSNFFLGGKRITFKLKSPWEKLHNFNSAAGGKFKKKQFLQIWGGWLHQVRTCLMVLREKKLAASDIGKSIFNPC